MRQNNLISRVIAKAQPLIYRFIKWYYRKPRVITKRGIKIKIYPSVFHPSFYLSTDIFLDFLLTINLTNKRILELGCGNGFISLYLTKHAQIESFASDINPTAVKGLQENALSNSTDITCIQSDLFDDIDIQNLDYILVNPPYFSEEVKSIDEYAFYTGPNFEYFIKFYQQSIPYLQQGCIVYLILSERADLDHIQQLAKQQNLKFLDIYKTEKNSEQFIIYQLTIN